MTEPGTESSSDTTPHCLYSWQKTWLTRGFLGAGIWAPHTCLTASLPYLWLSGATCTLLLVIALIGTLHGFASFLCRSHAQECILPVLVYVHHLYCSHKKIEAQEPKSCFSLAFPELQRLLAGKNDEAELGLCTFLQIFLKTCLTALGHISLSAWLAYWVWQSPCNQNFHSSWKGCQRLLQTAVIIYSPVFPQGVLLVLTVSG
jgi:hypothetical protein